MLYEGVLERKGALGFFSKRYCRLEENMFYIFRAENDPDPEDVLKIDSECMVQVDTGNRFRVATPTGIQVTLQASDASDMIRWVLELRACAFTNPRMSMDLFDIVAVIGRGHFGKVMLCRNKSNKELVAIKTVGKAKLIESKKLNVVMAERNILSKVRHPFIVEMKFAFQSEKKFYIGLEYAPGGDLFHHLELSLTVELDDVKIYIAEIALALDSLHKSGIIYRDLKPENVLFDAGGHIKLTDFGLSKEVRDDTSQYSFCGTSEYLAPEIVLKQKYSFSLDWWALGIMMYELLFGKSPFARSGMTKARIYENIVSGEPNFDDSAPEEVVDLIKSLLKKDPNERAGFEEIKASQLYKDWNWDDVLAKKLTPNFIPYITDDTDTTNFDTEYTKEETMDSDDDSYTFPRLPSIPGFSFTGFNQPNHEREHSTNDEDNSDGIPIDMD